MKLRIIKFCIWQWKQFYLSYFISQFYSYSMLYATISLQNIVLERPKKQIWEKLREMVATEGLLRQNLKLFLKCCQIKANSRIFFKSLITLFWQKERSQSLLLFPIEGEVKQNKQRDTLPDHSPLTSECTVPAPHPVLGHRRLPCKHLQESLCLQANTTFFLY